MSEINAKNVGYFSQLAYKAIGSLNDTLCDLNLPLELSDWKEIKAIPDGNKKYISLSYLISQISLNKSSSDGVFLDQFRVFTNNSDEIVIAFKGSTLDDWGYNFREDLANSGFTDYQRLASTFDTVYKALSNEFPSYKIVVDGHSLGGGGLAQTFALQYGLNGFGQNSLPVSSDAINQVFTQYEMVTEHDGVSLVSKDNVAAYMERYRPQVLRLDRRTPCNGYPALNFRESKGMTFPRVLIFPHGKGAKWLASGNYEHVKDSAAKMYVGITRARHSVAFVFDKASQVPGLIRFW